MNRKVFISILGTGLYGRCKYIASDFTSSDTTFIQQATLEYLHADSWPANSSAYIMTTEKARKTNWDRTIQSRNNPKTDQEDPYEGLENKLDQMNLPFHFQAVSIPDGKNEEEMWQIFQIIYNLLDDGDELHIDLTHSFRYLPMLLLVLSNYAKFLKNAHILSITYGNYDARDTKLNEAPIVDLLPLATLQDWTIAASNFKEFGKMGDLSDSIQSEIKKQSESGKRQRKIHESIQQLITSMRSFENSLSTCRGKEIMAGKDIKQIRDNIEIATSSQVKLPEPLKDVLLNIMDTLNSFTDSKKEKAIRPELKDQEDDIISLKMKDPEEENLRAAIDWCIHYNMVQQAYTLEQESIVTIVCKRLQSLNPYPKDAKTRERNFRDYISSILGISDQNLKEELSWGKDLSKYENLTKSLFALDWMKALRKAYAKLTPNRNQINHAGFIGNTSADSLIRQMQEPYQKCFAILSQYLPLPVLPQNGEPEKILINFSHHTSSEWEERQRKAAQIYGRVIDLTFPDVDAMEADEEKTNELISSYIKKIRDLASGKKATIHIMGEMTFVFDMVTKLKKLGFTCIASTTERNVKDLGNGRRMTSFKFVKFREYCISEKNKDGAHS